MKTIRVRGSNDAIVVGKILCLGRNYAEHAKEMQTLPGQPLVFLKPSTAIIHDGDDIVLPAISHEVHHEVELVVAIAADGKNIPKSRGEEFVLGYGVGLDMTLRDVQNEAKAQGSPWSIAKGFDTSAPVSEIIPARSVKNPAELEIRCSVNGTLRQHAFVNKMILSVPDTIAFVSSLFTLEQGDLIYTGTPEGVGKVVAGDTVVAELVGYTKLTHRVRSA